MDHRRLLRAPPQLRTSRLALEELTSSHAPELAAALDRDRAWLEARIPLPRDIEALEHHLRALEQARSAGTRTRYLLRTLDGPLVGCAGLDVVPARAAVALSCWLLSPHVGRGYAVEATGAMCQLALEHTGWDELEIEHAHDNIPSARIARALGFACVRRGELWRWVTSRVTIPAWHHVRDILSSVGTVTVPGDQGVMRIACADGSPADVWLVTIEAEAYVSLATTIGDEALFSPRAVLAHGASLAVGGLVLDDGAVQLRFGCAARGLTAESLGLVLHEATRLRSLVPRRVIAREAFAHVL